ncbi:MAG: hypothetical protein ACKO96_26485, partial [Flammeovirgaceae bacterium]
MKKNQESLIKAEKQTANRIDDLNVTVKRVDTQFNEFQKLTNDKLTTVERRLSELEGKSKMPSSIVSSFAQPNKKTSSKSEDSGIDPTKTLAAAGVVYTLYRLIKKFGFPRAVKIIARKLGYAKAFSLVARFFTGAVGGALTGGFVAAIMIAWTMKDLYDAVKALEEAENEPTEEEEQNKLKQLIETEERRNRYTSKKSRMDIIQGPESELKKYG